RPAKEYLEDGPELRRRAPICTAHLRKSAGHLPALASARLFDRMRQLRLDGRMTPADYRALADCAGLKGLKVLSLEQCGLGADNMRILAGTPWLAGVHGLGLAGN